MNQQYDFPPPPPPRSPGVSAPGSASFLDRRPPPVQPPSLTTNLVRTLAGSSQAPISATTSRTCGRCSPSPNTTSPYFPRSPGTTVPTGSGGTSPRTATMEYNPRQWSNRGGQISGSQMVFQQRANARPPGTQEITGMEGTFEYTLLRDYPPVDRRVYAEIMMVQRLIIPAIRCNAFAAAALQS